MTDLLTVARLAGVSRTTAARAFSEPEKVREATRDKVYAASETLGFRPNYVARQLRTRSTRIIGVMLPTLRNPVFCEQLQAMENSARERGYSLMIATTDYDADRESRVLENMLRQRVDGMILTVANACESACLRLLAQESLPAVLVHNPAASPEFITISVDNRQAICQATRHLLALGHRRIAMIAGPVRQSDRAALRYQGYCDAMTAAGLPAQPLIEMAHHTRVDVALLRPWLASGSALTALICTNDLLALSAIGNLQRLGWRVPTDISVIGFDGIALGEMVHPSLCSVVQPQRELGAAAMDSMMNLLANVSVRSQTLDFTLRQGESIAPARF